MASAGDDMSLPAIERPSSRGMPRSNRPPKVQQYPRLSNANTQSAPSIGTAHKRTRTPSDVNVTKAILFREDLVDKVKDMCEKLVGDVTDRYNISLVLDFMLNLRQASVDAVEAIQQWQAKQSDYSAAYKWNGVNYLMKMHHDLDFIADNEVLVAALGVAPETLRHNPFMMPTTLTALRTSLRKAGKLRPRGPHGKVQSAWRGDDERKAPRTQQQRIEAAELALVQQEVDAESKVGRPRTHTGSGGVPPARDVRIPARPGSTAAALQPMALSRTMPTTLHKHKPLGEPQAASKAQTLYLGTEPPRSLLSKAEKRRRARKHKAKRETAPEWEQPLLHDSPYDAVTGEGAFGFGNESLTSTLNTSSVDSGFYPQFNLSQSDVGSSYAFLQASLGLPPAQESPVIDQEKLAAAFQAHKIYEPRSSKGRSKARGGRGRGGKAGRSRGARHNPARTPIRQRPSAHGQQYRGQAPREGQEQPVQLSPQQRDDLMQQRQALLAHQAELLRQHRELMEAEGLAGADLAQTGGDASQGGSRASTAPQEPRGEEELGEAALAELEVPPPPPAAAADDDDRADSPAARRRRRKRRKRSSKRSRSRSRSKSKGKRTPYRSRNGQVADVQARDATQRRMLNRARSQGEHSGSHDDAEQVYLHGGMAGAGSGAQGELEEEQADELYIRVLGLRRHHCSGVVAKAQGAGHQMVLLATTTLIMLSHGASIPADLSWKAVQAAFADADALQVLLRVFDATAVPTFKIKALLPFLRESPLLAAEADEDESREQTQLAQVQYALALFLLKVLMATPRNTAIAGDEVIVKLERYLQGMPEEHVMPNPPPRGQKQPPPPPPPPAEGGSASRPRSRSKRRKGRRKGRSSRSRSPTSRARSPSSRSRSHSPRRSRGGSRSTSPQQQPPPPPGPPAPPTSAPPGMSVGFAPATIYEVDEEEATDDEAPSDDAQSTPATLAAIRAVDGPEQQRSTWREEGKGSSGDGDSTLTVHRDVELSNGEFRVITVVADPSDGDRIRVHTYNPQTCEHMTGVTNPKNAAKFLHVKSSSFRASATERMRIMEAVAEHPERMKLRLQPDGSFAEAQLTPVQELKPHGDPVVHATLTMDTGVAFVHMYTEAAEAVAGHRPGLLVKLYSPTTANELALHIPATRVAEFARSARVKPDVYSTAFQTKLLGHLQLTSVPGSEQQVLRLVPPTLPRVANVVEYHISAPPSLRSLGFRGSSVQGDTVVEEKMDGEGAQVLREQATHAAVSIQSQVRRRQARAAVAAKRRDKKQVRALEQRLQAISETDEGSQLDKAAVRVQTVERQRQARKRVAGVRRDRSRVAQLKARVKEEDIDARTDTAVVRLQSQVRGAAARRRVSAKRSKMRLGRRKTAATRIQALHRGRVERQQSMRLKKQAKTAIGSSLAGVPRPLLRAGHRLLSGQPMLLTVTRRPRKANGPRGHNGGYLLTASSLTMAEEEILELELPPFTNAPRGDPDKTRQWEIAQLQEKLKGLRLLKGRLVIGSTAHYDHSVGARLPAVFCKQIPDGDAVAKVLQAARLQDDVEEGGDVAADIPELVLRSFIVSYYLENEDGIEPVTESTIVHIDAHDMEAVSDSHLELEAGDCMQLATARHPDAIQDALHDLALELVVWVQADSAEDARLRPDAATRLVFAPHQEVGEVRHPAAGKPPGSSQSQRHIVSLDAATAAASGSFRYSRTNYEVGVLLKGGYKVSGRSMLFSVQRTPSGSFGFDATDVATGERMCVSVLGLEAQLASGDPEAFDKGNKVAVLDTARLLVSRHMELVVDEGLVELRVVTVLPEPLRCTRRISGVYYVFNVGAVGNGVYVVDVVDPRSGWTASATVTSLDAGLSPGGEYQEEMKGLCEDRLTITGMAGSRQLEAL